MQKQRTTPSHLGVGGQSTQGPLDRSLYRPAPHAIISPSSRLRPDLSPALLQSLSLLPIAIYSCFLQTMSSNDNSNLPRSLPIPIGSRRRSGSVSVSCSSDSGSTSPASPLQSPTSGALPRIAPITPSTSPILSYFLSQSPKSPPNATFPFRRGMAPPVYEGPFRLPALRVAFLFSHVYFCLMTDDEVFESEKAAPTRHARSASTAWPTGDRFAAPPVAPLPGQQDRAAGLLRRLSLGGNMARVSSVASPVFLRIS